MTSLIERLFEKGGIKTVAQACRNRTIWGRPSRIFIEGVMVGDEPVLVFQNNHDGKRVWEPMGDEGCVQIHFKPTEKTIQWSRNGLGAMG